MTQKSAPGPVGTSCLTCKRRHKKCDQRRPVCTRCEKGGFECLGYNHHRSTTHPILPMRSKPRLIAPATQQKERLSIQPLVHRTIIIDEPARSRIDECNTDWSSSIGDSSEVASASTSTSPSPPTSFRVPQTIIHSKDNHTKSIITRNYLSPFDSRIDHSRHASSLPSLQQIFISFSRIPNSPSNPTTAFLRSPQFEDYIVAHFGRMMGYAYFKPMKNHKARFIEMIVSRLRASWIARWVMLLDARICESLITDTMQPQLYNRWIRDIEGAVRTVLAQDSTSPEAHCLQGDFMELAVMKSMLAPGSGAIQVLRSAAPTFLQIAYSCPELWSESSDPTFIPLLRVTTSNRHELASFALFDCTCAMVFGVPQQVEYDTSAGSLHEAPWLYEWSHSSPVEFQLLLAEINACRDKRPKVRDWREIERQLVTWIARPAQHDATWESWMVVAWLAVQESWRLTLLAYLYLAVCGASSNEPRVQLCVSQVLKVFGTVKEHESPDVSIPFFVQYLMVGICAAREDHRKIVRDKLSSNSETKFWRLRGTDFVPVLDHLWHGVGSDGHPIKWSDYIRSRETWLPLAV
ncbi:unnamed protein product [Rhizoctonia solani]|uniref:Zn(2)-C6 fungal-type domain-containing protein n=1 Tax=Rhizoctonia solani TaxID=456999 RepID=A0A8H3ASF0_9AGAM|nr:unnamed protein product [Rhizoctonia solani]